MRDADTRARAIEVYEEYIERAVREQNTEGINIMAQCLVEAEEAKQILRDKGYGWTGLGLEETAKLVPEDRT